MFEKQIYVPPDGFRTSALFHELQEISGEAAAEWHAAGSDLQKIGLMWIVIRYDIQLHRVLLPGECLYMRTWALPVRHRMSQRNYQIFDTDNRCVLSGAGVWAVSDRVKRIMVNPADYGIQFDTELSGPEQAKPTQPHRISISDFFSYSVPETALDINCHMNNTRYFDMVEINAITHYETFNLKHAKVTYVNEARLGEELTVKFGNEKQLWYFSGAGPRGNCFEMSLEYYPNSDKSV